MTAYLTVQQAIDLHEEQIDLYGGSHGIRDKGALEAAIARPQTGYYADIIAEAAALLESLAGNHPFIDGNKRIAFYAADIFLNINGFEIVADPMDVHKHMIGLFESGTFKFEAVEAMLRDITRAKE